jgi:hypothetical protein
VLLVQVGDQRLSHRQAAGLSHPRHAFR